MNNRYIHMQGVLKGPINPSLADAFPTKTNTQTWLHHVRNLPSYPILGYNPFNEGDVVEEGKDFKFGNPYKEITATSDYNSVAIPIKKVVHTDQPLYPTQPRIIIQKAWDILTWDMLTERTGGDIPINLIEQIERRFNKGPLTFSEKLMWAGSIISAYRTTQEIELLIKAKTDLIEYLRRSLDDEKREHGQLKEQMQKYNIDSIKELTKLKEELTKLNEELKGKQWVIDELKSVFKSEVIENQHLREQLNNKNLSE